AAAPKLRDISVQIFVAPGPIQINAIGMDRLVAGRFWNGDIMALELYDYKLDEAQIRAASSRLLAEFPPKWKPLVTLAGNSLMAGNAVGIAGDVGSVLLESGFANDVVNAAIGGSTTPYWQSHGAGVDVYLDSMRASQVHVFWEGSNHLAA